MNIDQENPMTSTKTLADMTAEIRTNNIEKGSRPAEGGPGDNTFGDDIALLHSQVSEALEAYRDWRLDDPTEWFCNQPDCPRYRRIPSAAACNVSTALPAHPLVLGKPHGVGSELADVLIRLLDMCDVFGMRTLGWDGPLSEIEPAHLPHGSFGDSLTALHRWISTMQAPSSGAANAVLRVLVAVARRYGIDLAAEYERKAAYNRTRSYQHGGRTLAGKPGSA